MKVFGFCVVLSLSAFICFAFSNEGTDSVSHGLVWKKQVTERTMISKTRRLKDGGFSLTCMKDEKGHADLEDYRPIDPSPSSKASIRPGPIQHGTPYMPYVPKLFPPPPPPPPGHPKQGGVP